MATVNGNRFRIGEVSKRSGVSPELLRAWERRYGLLRPERSPGGLRLYSTDDVERVLRMREHMAAGLAAAEAAALAAEAPAGAVRTGAAVDAGAIRGALSDALDRFDEPTAHAVLDELLAAATVDAALSDVVLPYLHELGDRWQAGDISVAQEHFASGVLRGRLLGLARGWARGLGPFALLACLPDEQHDLGLIAFGIALRDRGWRIAYLGSDTPLDSLADAARAIAPELVALSTVAGERIDAVAPRLRELAKAHRLALGGAGTRDADPEALGALALTRDPVAEAERVTGLFPGGG